jgi:hypothetical protein
MLVTVVKQTYTRNIAVDTSGYFNQGIPINVTASYPGFVFAAPGSRININPSSSLASLGCINLEVTFKLSPLGTAHRYNLAEGFESFALFVEPDLSLWGTIFDANSNWTGAASPAGQISAGETHVAALQADGINMVRVLLDGQVVGTNYAVHGAVRGVGSMGLAVGHWPNPANQYAFEGTIFAILLQKYLPQSDLALLDSCCFDRAALADWFRAMQKKGISANKLTQASEALQAASLKATVALRGDDASRTAKHLALAAALKLAVKRRDCDALERVLKEFAQLAASIPPATRDALAKELQQALDGFDLSASDWNKLLCIFCLSPCGCDQGAKP